jgi:peroxiredoxin
MKKTGILVALALLLALIGYYLFTREQAPAPAPAVQNAEPAPSAPASPASDLPDLTITKLDNSQVRVKELKGRNILVLFQPDCDHCQRETKEIKAHLPAFKDYTLYFVSNYPADQLRQFSRDYELAFEPNVVFATATLEGILNTLGPQPSPSVYIYDEQGRLVKSFLGETKVENILQAL